MPTANSVSVASGSTAVTGNETIFTGYPGDLILIGGLAAVVASFDDASHLTLVQPWPAASVVDEDGWAIVPTAPGRSSTVTLNNRLADIIDRIEDGFALGNVTGLVEALAAKASVQALTDGLAAKAGKGAFDAHTGATNNPHGVTKGQVGLGSADNTSDADKPVSTAVAQALADGLAGKVAPSGSGIAADHLALFTSGTGKAIRSGGKVGAAATRDVGVIAGTVAAGDDARIVPIGPRLQPTHGALLAADARRLIRFTGTSTQAIGKAADLGAGWSVYLSNEGPGIQTFTPDGAELIDGLGGSRFLLPKQKALLVCDGVGFAWIWIERYPVLSNITAETGVGYMAPVIPAGWKRVALDFQLTVDTLGAQPRLQLSQDNDATPYTGNYFNQSVVGLPSGAVAGAQTTPYFAIGGATGTAKGSCTVDGVLDVDPTGLIKLAVKGIQNGSAQSEARMDGGYTGVIGAITNLRVYASSGSISGRSVIRGVF